MSQGKILKIRLGHEANCSSGMVSGMIMAYACMGQVPVAIITASMQMAAARMRWPKIGRRLTWIVPQVLGLAFIVFYFQRADYGWGYSRYPYETITTTATFATGFALAISLGYFLTQRLRSPIWAIPIVPAAFVASVIPLNYAIFGILDLLHYYLGPVPV